MDGILLVDKPGGKTSHDVVSETRRRLGERRVGHAGTLDPSATGLLVLGVGTALRLLEFMRDHGKTYEFSVEFGILTETDDADGARIEEVAVPDRAGLETAAARFTGEFLQRPPRYSAVKVAGKRLYQYARSGKEVELPERRVRVDELTILAYDPPRARFRLRGSSGIYVRSIARDLGGHVVQLRRLASGPFRVEDVGPDLLPVDAGLGHLPAVTLSEEEALRFEHGVRLEREGPPLARVYGNAGFLGIGEGNAGIFKARKVIAGLRHD